VAALTADGTHKPIQKLFEFLGLLSITFQDKPWNVQCETTTHKQLSRRPLAHHLTAPPHAAARASEGAQQSPCVGARWVSRLNELGNKRKGCASSDRYRLSDSTAGISLEEAEEVQAQSSDPTK